MQRGEKCLDNWNTRQGGMGEAILRWIDTFRRQNDVAVVVIGYWYCRCQCESGIVRFVWRITTET